MGQRSMYDGEGKEASSHLRAEAYPIPRRTNVALCGGLFAGFLLLLHGSAVVSTPLAIVGIAVSFATLMIPVYSLLHEALHEVLHPDSRMNYGLGLVLSATFMAPFSFLQSCHWGHHRRNRSDYELFDLYYPGESRARKAGFLIFLRLGFYWLSLPISCVLFVVAPRVLEGNLLRRWKSIDAMTRELKAGAPFRMKLEAFSVLVFHTALYFALGLHVRPLLLLYGVHAFVWSSHDYVNHAFSRRDVINGAYNHRMPVFFQRWLFLNFNLHLAHHQHPHLPWNALESVVPPESMQTTYLGAWIDLWKGPRITTEPTPQPVERYFPDVR
ncbi:MAG: fatty acid desaturase [Bdellovibrionota bacterium]